MALEMVPERLISFPEDRRDEVLRRVQDAILQVKIDEVTRTVGDSPVIETVEFAEFFYSLQAESDRAVPIIAQAYLDEQLLSLLSRAMNPEVLGGLQAIFEGFGPLSSVNARVTVANALYWITDQTAADLHVLRRIRNHFAHQHSASFADDKVAGQLANHGLLGAILKALGVDRFNTRGGAVYAARAGGYVPIFPDPRLEYLIAVVTSTAHLVTELSTAPVAWRLGLHPGAYMSRREVWPEWLAALNSSVPHLVVRLMDPEDTTGQQSTPDDSDSDS